MPTFLGRRLIAAKRVSLQISERSAAIPNQQCYPYIFTSSSVLSSSSQVRTYFHRTLYYPFQSRNEDDEFLMPPSSHAKMYTNLFDQADDPKLFIAENETSPKHGDLHPTDYVAELPMPNIDPHRFAHSHGSPDMQYTMHFEPPFPEQPNLAKGELACGANVVRTNVWHTPGEPAITSISRFEPSNFQPVGYAENNISPDHNLPDYYAQMDEFRLRPGHADRRVVYYLAQAGMMASFAWGARTIIYWLLAAFMTMEPGAFWPKPMEVKFRMLAPGDQITVSAAGSAVFIRHRDDEEIRLAKADDSLIDTFRDPQLDSDRCPDPEWLFCSAVCTHLGCTPHRGGDFGGYLCPCHGSHYDSSARIRLGPAPKNLPIAKYEFVDDETILVGEAVSTQRRWV